MWAFVTRHLVNKCTLHITFVRIQRGKRIAKCAERGGEVSRQFDE